MNKLKKLSKPNMILFDYGDTLLYEPGFDFLRGEAALFQYITKNKYNLGPEDINKFANKLFFEEIGNVRKIGMELHERQFQQFVYEYLGIEFSIPFKEAEIIKWRNASPGAVMPEADKMLDAVNEKGIRSGIISNLGFSANALKERLDRLLPNHRFELIITSSEYGFRKPSHYLFELALRKADLSAGQVWYCGDNPQADIEGAAGVGIYPVWYDNDMQLDRREREREQEAPRGCEYLYINEWRELIEILEQM